MVNYILTANWKIAKSTHLSLLLVEVVDDDADEEVEGEEGAEDNEDDKIEVHVEVDLLDGLLLYLGPTHTHVCVR